MLASTVCRFHTLVSLSSPEVTSHAPSSDTEVRWMISECAASSSRAFSPSCPPTPSVSPAHNRIMVPNASALRCVRSGRRYGCRVWGDLDVPEVDGAVLAGHAQVAVLVDEAAREAGAAPRLELADRLVALHLLLCLVPQRARRKRRRRHQLAPVLREVHVVHFPAVLVLRRHLPAATTPRHVSTDRERAGARRVARGTWRGPRRGRSCRGRRRRGGGHRR
eukprot:1379515-Rhodomonas_salina.1